MRAVGMQDLGSAQLGGTTLRCARAYRISGKCTVITSTAFNASLVALPHAASLPSFFLFVIFCFFFPSSMIALRHANTDTPDATPLPRSEYRLQAEAYSRCLFPHHPTRHRSYQLHLPCEVVSLLVQSKDAPIVSGPIRCSMHTRASCASRVADRLWLDYEVLPAIDASNKRIAP